MEIGRVLTGVMLLIQNTEGKYLVIKRLDADEKECYAFPGGHIENESIQMAARREGKEELNIDITATSIIAFTEDNRENGIRYITFFLKCMYKGVPTIMEPDKCLEILWRDLWDIPAPYFIPLSNFLNVTKRNDVGGWHITPSGRLVPKN